MANAVLTEFQYAGAAAHRIRDAESLCARQRWTATIYVSGYSVECMLKAELARRLRQMGGWLTNQDDVLYRVMWIHDLVTIARALAYPPNLVEEIKRLCQVWHVALRYSSTGGNRAEAEATLALASEISRSIRMRLT